MRQVRVLQLLAGLATDTHFGGAELFGIRLARHLDPDIFVSGVCGLWRYDSPQERAWLADLPQVSIAAEVLVSPSGNLIDDAVRALSALWRFVDRFRPDIINSHGEQSDFLAGLIHILHPLHPCAIRTMHTDQQWQDRPWLGALLVPWVFPWLFNDEIAISEAVRQVLDRRPMARLLRKRPILFYNGIEASLFDAAPPAGKMADWPLVLDGKEPCLGVVGRLVMQKGHHDLLQAISIVLQTRPVHLLIIGSGPLAGELLQQCEGLGIQGRVHFLGSRSDVLAILSHLHLVVSSSLWEGFPTVLLEAMALGKPVVATNVSGSSELVQNGITGLLVPPQQPVRLAAAILELLSNPFRAQQMAETARQFARQFTIQNSAQRYSQLYQHEFSSRIR